ncbi:hypothetical protein ABTG54_21330, partial [Acinetobacter baumannii]
YTSDEILDLCARHPGHFAGSTPLRAEAGEGVTVAAFKDAVQDALDKARTRKTCLGDIVERYPHLREPRLSVGIMDGESANGSEPLGTCAL